MILFIGLNEALEKRTMFILYISTLSRIISNVLHQTIIKVMIIKNGPFSFKMYSTELYFGMMIYGKCLSITAFNFSLVYMKIIYLLYKTSNVCSLLLNLITNLKDEKENKIHLLKNLNVLGVYVL